MNIIFWNCLSGAIVAGTAVISLVVITNDTAPGSRIGIGAGLKSSDTSQQSVPPCDNPAPVNVAQGTQEP